MDAVWLLAAAAVIILGCYASSIRVLKEDERLAVFRLGRQVGVRGPGRVFLLPIIDKGIRVNLAESIAGWRGMSKSELEKRIVETALGGPRGH